MESDRGRAIACVSMTRMSRRFAFRQTSYPNSRRWRCNPYRLSRFRLHRRPAPSLYLDGHIRRQIYLSPSIAARLVLWDDHFTTDIDLHAHEEDPSRYFRIRTHTKSAPMTTNAPMTKNIYYPLSYPRSTSPPFTVHTLLQAPRKTLCPQPRLFSCQFPIHLCDDRIYRFGVVQRDDLQRWATRFENLTKTLQCIQIRQRNGPLEMLQRRWKDECGDCAA